MILRTIIYIGIILFFTKDIKTDKKPFKKYVFPIIVITYIAGTDWFLKADSRIQLTSQILTGLFVVLYLSGYYSNYKLERYKEKKRIREERKIERYKRDEELLQEISQVKHKGIKKRSASYEITMDLPNRSSDDNNQTKTLNGKEEDILLEDKLDNVKTDYNDENQKSSKDDIKIFDSTKED